MVALRSETASRIRPWASPLNDEQLVEFTMAFRQGMLDGKSSRGYCYMVCAPLAGLLHLHGVDCDIGEVKDSKWSGLGIDHCFLKLADGRVLDPTADQFSTRDKPLPPVYLGEPLDGLHVTR